MLLLLVAVSLLAVVVLFFAWGFAVARARGRSGIAWGLLAACTGFIGIAILYGLGRKVSAEGGDRQPLDRHLPPGLAIAAPHGAAGLGQDGRLDEPGHADGDRRWHYLCLYHPAVREAVAGLADLGPGAVAELRAAHEAIGDPALLPEIVRQIRATGQAAPAMDGQPMYAAPDGPPPPDALPPYDAPVALPAPGPGASARPVGRRRPPEVSGPGERAIRGGRPAERAPPRLEAPREPAMVEDHNGEEALDIGALVARRLEPGPDGSRPGAVPSGAGRDEPVLDLTAGSASEPASADSGPAESREAGLPEPGPVTEADLESAVYVETYRDVHLFQTAAGRIFVDRIGLVDSLEGAKRLIERAARNAASA